MSTTFDPRAVYLPRAVEAPTPGLVAAVVEVDLHVRILEITPYGFLAQGPEALPTDVEYHVRIPLEAGDRPAVLLRARVIYSHDRVRWIDEGPVYVSGFTFLGATEPASARSITLLLDHASRSLLDPPIRRGAGFLPAPGE